MAFFLSWAVERILYDFPLSIPFRHFLPCPSHVRPREGWASARRSRTRLRALWVAFGEVPFERRSPFCGASPRSQPSYRHVVFFAVQIPFILLVLPSFAWRTICFLALFVVVICFRSHEKPPHAVTGATRAIGRRTYLRRPVASSRNIRSRAACAIRHTSCPYLAEILARIA